MPTTDDHRDPTRTPLILAGVAFVLSLILRQIPVLGWVIYPFQLFVTLVHELSHGVAALITGGRFLNFTVSPTASGLAITSGGWRWLIVPAGYIGAALFGGTLLVLTQRLPRAWQRRWLASSLGLFFGLMTVLFARSPTAVIVGSMAALCLLALARFGPRLWVTFGLDLLAIQCILNALDSLVGLAHLSASPLNTPSDAQSMAQLTHLPPFFWALLWTVTALLILFASLYLSFRWPNGRVTTKAPRHAGQ